jgi:F420-dependent oxidoreductase-like protein
MDIRLAEGSLIVLVGPPASGKSTWAAANFPPHQVVSSDALRALVGSGEHDQRASKDAFALLDDVIARRLRRRLTTVVDTLGTDAPRRARWRAAAADAGVPCVAIVFDADPTVFRARNRARDRPVPARVLASMLEGWPAVRDGLADEGFAAVHRADTTTDTDAVPTTDTAATDAPATGASRPTDAVAAPAADEATAATAATAAPVADARRPGIPTVRVVAPDLVEAPAAAARQADAPARLEFGLQLPRFTWPGGPTETRAGLAHTAAAAEAAGFTSIWVMDHMLQIPQAGRHWEDILESYTTLGFLACATSTARLGTLVTGVTYRNLAHLAKIVATLDVLSGGRAVCGIGAAWFEREHRAYGWRFPPLAERYALLEDALQLLPVMWGKGAPAWSGRTTQVPEAVCYPRPLQDHVPILVGGGGEKRTLRLVARHADMCNITAPDLDVVRRKVAVLHGHCATEGRAPADVTVTHLSTVPAIADGQAVEEQIGRYRLYADAGVKTAIVNFDDLTTTGSLDRFADVIAAFRA